MAAVNPAAPEPRMMRFLAPLMGTHRPRKGLDACAPGAAIPNRANRRRIQVWVHQIVNHYRRFRNVPAQSPYGVSVVAAALLGLSAVAQAAPSTWTIDPSHSNVTFSI